MRSLDQLVEDYLRLSEVDYIALPQITSAARWEFHAPTTENARKLSLEIVRRLYEKGLRPGDYWGGPFDHWPDEGCQAALDRIEREWIAFGDDPNLGDPYLVFQHTIVKSHFPQRIGCGYR